jgi:hypothetical protein
VTRKEKIENLDSTNRNNSSRLQNNKFKRLKDTPEGRKCQRTRMTNKKNRKNRTNGTKPRNNCQNSKETMISRQQKTAIDYSIKQYDYIY